MTPPTAIALDPSQREMIMRGVSVIVSSRDAALRASLMRAVGSQLAADGTVTVYVARSQSRQLLLDVAATGQVAVVFSHPASHRSFQLKARDARLRAAGDEDRAVIERYRDAMTAEIARVGFSEAFTRVMLSAALEDTAAIEFRPDAAFDQTPGPQAGQALPS